MSGLTRTLTAARSAWTTWFGSRPAIPSQAVAARSAPSRRTAARGGVQPGRHQVPGQRGHIGGGRQRGGLPVVRGVLRRNGSQRVAQLRHGQAEPLQRRLLAEVGPDARDPLAQGGRAACVAATVRPSGSGTGAGHRRRDRVVSFPAASAGRGLLDRLAGGVGLRRGRRDPRHLLIGDALDFWRVEAIEPGNCCGSARR